MLINKENLLLLSTQNIAKNISDRQSGIYLLCLELPDVGKVQVLYVGRSDKCLKSRLLMHPLRSVATHFCFATTDDETQAFITELETLHFVANFTDSKLSGITIDDVIYSRDLNVK